jgi:RNA polymerase sigma-70 factor (ECF subfamily)
LDRGQSDEVLNQKEDFSQTDGAEEATLSDERKQLKVAFRLLPPDQREVLELSYFKGFNHKEISVKLDLSLGTVKSRIRLGVEKLRNSLSTLRL